MVAKNTIKRKINLYQDLYPQQPPLKMLTPRIVTFMVFYMVFGHPIKATINGCIP